MDYLTVMFDALGSALQVTLINDLVGVFALALLVWGVCKLWRN